jgi:hypothetical protein
MAFSKNCLILGPFLGLLVFVSAALAVAGDGNFQARTLVEAKRIAIVIPTIATKGEEIIAATLKKRIERRSKVQAQVRRDSEQAGEADPDLEIVVRRAATVVPAQRPADAVPTLEDGPLRPEAYFVHTETGKGPLVLLAEGADLRGELYAAGEVLRRLTYLPDAIQLRAFSVRSAPAFRWRGSSSNQGGTMMQVTGACHLERHVAGVSPSISVTSRVTRNGGRERWSKAWSEPGELFASPFIKGRTIDSHRTKSTSRQSVAGLRSSSGLRICPGPSITWRRARTSIRNDCPMPA